MSLRLMARLQLTRFALLSLALVLPACSKDSSEPARPKAPAGKKAVSAEEAQKQFKLMCASCHGETGKGDGPGSAGLTPKPRDFSDPDWQASVTDKHINTIILRGGASVGKSPAMPPQPLLKSKPELLEAIVRHVRGFKK